jgi:hypothetical protein
LNVAGRTLIGIEARPKAIRHTFDVEKFRLPIIEEKQFVCCESRERPSGTGIAATNAGITHTGLRLAGRGLTARKDNCKVKDRSREEDNVFRDGSPWCGGFLIW